MLCYLAAALPDSASAATRLIALQCALRINASMQVTLPLGLLRSLRLGTNAGPWRELEHVRWLRRISGPATGAVVVQLLDTALLTQAPARPDRCHAADWALRVSCPPLAGAIGPLPQLVNVYVAACSDPETGRGQSECDRMARDCGVRRVCQFNG
ncbi:hypothetical protein [Streptomyces sp. VNUA24]|uniref:hypothetical protein n=1 Tax=Streptomyces sp. VNUA24 TaxID=3031131 RepID=UPI0023B7A08A|nr:hypothetical protein [Streptomyces sp. VNUA24]WEH12203.1 hypothetical protein PYR72_00170 [Streptomyces sp. VNUA24]